MKCAIKLFFCFLIFETPIHAKNEIILVNARNLSNNRQTNEIVSIQWNDLVRVCKDIIPDSVSVHEVGTGKVLISQIIDMDQNGTPEELIFLASFEPEEKKIFEIYTSDKSNINNQQLTDARFMTPREDLAWENDRIAYRMYGPALAKEVNNGIDVWCKRVRYPIIEKWYKGDEAPGAARISYHEDHGEGADFFNVGKSLGCGGSALFKDDSLYQPGVFSSYKIIASGPIRSIFELKYNPVNYDGKSITETRIIKLEAGSNLNEIEVTYRSDSAAGSVKFAAGLVKRPGVSVFIDQAHGCAGLWGPTNESKENGFLGTGIVMPKYFFSEIKDDSLHLLAIGNVRLGEPVTYYSGAGWTLSGDFKDENDWNKYLIEKTKSKMETINIEVKKDPVYRLPVKLNINHGDYK